MEETYNSKENHDLNIMDVINLGIVVLLSLKNTLIFLISFFILIGFFSTSTIESQYISNSRILIELQNINLKDEQNIDFSSLNSQAIQTEIEKIKSNTLIHNVIKNNNIELPTFKISKENSSFITILADKILSYSGISFFLSLFNEAASSVKQEAVIATLDIALDTVVSNVDEKKVSEVSDKIRNEFKLNDKQNQKLQELQERFKKDKPDADEVMSFAYGVLLTNDYSEQEIIELARKYLPESFDLSDEVLNRFIKKYKTTYIPENLADNILLNYDDDISTNMQLNNESKNKEPSKIRIDDEKDDFSLPVSESISNIDAEEALDYFERIDSSEFNLGLINWIRANLKVQKEDNANVLSISFISSNPELSILVTNSVAEEYLNYQMISKESAGKYSTEYYQQRIDDLRNKQDNLSTRILDYESKHDIYDNKVENLELDLKSYEDEIRGLTNEKNEFSN